MSIPGMRISGKLWGAVLESRSDGSTILRELPKRPARRTAAQDAAAARFKPVADAWRALDRSESEAWRRYAKGRGGQAYPAFTALTTKCLQMRPDAPVPRVPPTSEFAGDGIEVAARATVGTPSLPSPSGEGEAFVVFSANGANAPGVVTEILLQRLKSPHRKPVLKEYRTRRFVAFAAGALETTVALAPGPWACAVRFVREGTGQEGAVIEIGVVQVG